MPFCRVTHTSGTLALGRRGKVKALDHTQQSSNKLIVQELKAVTGVRSQAGQQIDSQFLLVLFRQVCHRDLLFEMKIGQQVFKELHIVRMCVLSVVSFQDRDWGLRADPQEALIDDLAEEALEDFAFRIERQKAARHCCERALALCRILVKDQNGGFTCPGCSLGNISKSWMTNFSRTVRNTSFAWTQLRKRS